MKLALMSDLHMEFWEDIPRFINNIVDLTPNADVIALAGDIGVLCHTSDCIEDLVDKLSNKGKVIFISGNHCFYGRPFECGLIELERLSNNFKNNKNVMINNGSPQWIEEGQFNILAGTLWFPDLGFSDFEKGCLADFKVKGLTEYTYRYNTYFKNMLEMTNKKNIITISHHSPSYKSVAPRFAGSHLNRFFCDNMDELLREKKVLLACHGHLHDPVDYFINKTRVCSAPYGYPSEAKAGWAPKLIEL